EKRVFLVILFTSFSGSLVSRIPGAVQHQGNSADTTRCSEDPLNRIEITFLVEKHTGRPGKGRRKVTASG
ncbi:hypothetical protein, partial [Escherichia coli]|uniref:hypothetical protein n=1 Tax=Escherichia coli TaxID=562 RepID=UPI00346479AE